MKTMKKTVVLLAAIAMMSGYAFAQQPEKNTEAEPATEQTAPESEAPATEQQEEQTQNEEKPCDENCKGEECPKAE